jgi:hypothetical protein
MQVGRSHEFILCTLFKAALWKVEHSRGVPTIAKRRNQANEVCM